MAQQRDPRETQQASGAEREDPALRLSGGGANPLQIAITFLVAAAIVGLVLYGVNNQYPVDGADPSTVASAPGASPATPQAGGGQAGGAGETAGQAPPQQGGGSAQGAATGGQAAGDAPAQPSTNEGRASPQPGQDPAAPQPERGTADRGQPGRATGNDGGGSTPAERPSGGEQRLNQ